MDMEWLYQIDVVTFYPLMKCVLQIAGVTGELNRITNVSLLEEAGKIGEQQRELVCAKNEECEKRKRHRLKNLLILFISKSSL